MTAPNIERGPSEVDGLIGDHLNLARSLARRFHHRGERNDDLEQVALLALVRAAGRYDKTRNVAFATYATTSVLGELKRHFRDRAWMIRPPRRIHDLYLQIGPAREALHQRLGRPPTIGEIADHLGHADDDVLEAIEAGAGYHPTPLDTPTQDDARSPADMLPAAGDPIEERLDHLRLSQVLLTLGDLEQHVVRRYFFDDRTQLEIGEEIGVSQMQVSRILARSLGRLRSAF